MSGLKVRMQTKISSYTFRFFLSACCLLCTLLLQAQPQKLLEQADSLTRLNQYDAANEKLIAFIKAYPQRKYDLGEAYCESARNCLYLKKLQQAITYNEASVAIRTNIAPDALGWNEKLLARIKLAQGAYEAALDHATEAAAYPYFDDPLVPAEIALLQSEIHQQMGAYGKALEAAEAAKEIVHIIEGPEAPLLADIHLQRGNLLAIQEQWPAAAAASRSAIELRDHPEANLLLGQAMLAMGNTSPDTKKHLIVAQKRGLQSVKMEASLALARLELTNENFNGVIAQLDSAEPLINDQLNSKGHKSHLHTTVNGSPGKAAAQAAYLRSCAWLLESSEEAPRKSFQAARNGLQLLDDTDPQLRAQLFEEGFLALVRLQNNGSKEDTLYADLWNWTQYYLQQSLMEETTQCKTFTLDYQEFKALLPRKTAAAFFLPGVAFDFALYTFEDTLQLLQLEPIDADPVIKELRAATSEAMPASAFSVLFSPLESYPGKLEKLLLLMPSSWAAARVLNLPVSSFVKTGIWPFRRKDQSLKDRYEVLQSCSFTLKGNPESRGKDNPHPH